MGRYSTLYKLSGPLYETGSPLLVSAGALLEDSQIGRVLAQLKFRNIGNKEIKAVRVSVRAYDIDGEEVEGVEDFQYLDLSAALGEEFGDRRAVPLPNPVARSIGVTVKRVLFEDDTSWSAPFDEPWIALPHPQPLADALGSSELASQYARETTDRARVAPMEIEDLWYCSCGWLNKDSADYCSGCGVERELAFEAMDERRLERNYMKWTEHQDMDNSVEEIHTKKKKSKLMKVLLILLPILIVIAGGVYAVAQYVLPMLAYQRAEEKLTLNDFTGAIESFTALGDYKDSADKVIAAHYAQAEELLKSGDYSSSRTEFILLGDYKDSAEQVKKCDYQAAAKLLEGKHYDEAREAFLALGDYGDSAEQANAALYSKAAALAADGDNSGAVEIFKSLGDYSDSAAQITAIREAEVEQVNRLIRQNKFEDAWAAYEKLEEYQPDALSAEDFVNPDGDMCSYLDENTVADKFFGTYHYLANGYDSRKDITVTARDIRLTDQRIAVLMAYGEPDETGDFITTGGFYTQLPSEETQAQMAEECDHYIRYSYKNYRLYFYFNADDELTWIIYSNEDYFCSTPDPTEDTAEAAPAAVTE